jgi:soluble lytic murein transglycosylase-like protein
MTPTPDLIALAKSKAQRYQVDPAIFCGLIERESSWDPGATRYEPAFYLKYVKSIPGISLQEAHDRSTSWSYCQPMGQVLRENGFTGNFTDLMTNADLALDWGAKILANKIRREGGNVTQGLLAWNGGGNPMYGTDVLNLSVKYRDPGTGYA